MIGMKLTIAYSIITTSMAKMTPAIGVLNEAPIAAAVPQATSVRTQLSGSRNASPEQAGSCRAKMHGWPLAPARESHCETHDDAGELVQCALPGQAAAMTCKPLHDVDDAEAARVRWESVEKHP